MVQGGGLCVVPGSQGVDGFVDQMWTMVLLRWYIRWRMELDV